MEIIKTWNQLSRLQRILIYLFVVSVLLMLLYILINTHRSRESIGKLVEEHRNKLEPIQKKNGESKEEAAPTTPPPVRKIPKYAKKPKLVIEENGPSKEKAALRAPPPTQKIPKDAKKPKLVIEENGPSKEKAALRAPPPTQKIPKDAKKPKLVIEENGPSKEKAALRAPPPTQKIPKDAKKPKLVIEENGGSKEEAAPPPPPPPPPTQKIPKDAKKPNLVIEENATVGPYHSKFSGPKNSRQQAVVDGFKHAWAGYKKFAWGHDILKPLSKTYDDPFGLGLTLVDGLDTMYIMNLQTEFNEAREWVASSLNFDINRNVNLFQTTILVLGGLLSTYHLSGDNMFLEKATDLGARLLPCFDTISGVPLPVINLSTMRAHSYKIWPGTPTSEVTAIQLEFRALSRATGNSKYENAAARVSQHVHRLPKADGLVPIFIDPLTGQFRALSTITLGAGGDGYYEYLLKQWVQTGRTIDYLKEDYLQAIQGVEEKLMKRTPKNKLLFVGELLTGRQDFKPKMDHLTCYLPGIIALGVHYGLPQHHMKLAEDLAYTCYMTYAMQPTFLAPEISYFSFGDNNAAGDIYVKSNVAHNLLRPELLESLWILYQITGNTTYQDWGWSIFQGFEKYTKVANGYTSIGNVMQPLNTRPKDVMESFFLGETLKYLYLLFSDDREEINLKEWVVNSEAHPLPVYPS